MTNLTAQGAPELPPLPRAAVDEHNLQGGRLLYEHSQMRAFATAAVIADRQARQAAPEAPREPASAVSPDVAGMLQQCIDALMECDRDGDYPLIENIREAVSLFAIDRLAASEAEAVNAPRFPFVGYDPKFCPGSNPDNPQEWTDEEEAVKVEASEVIDRLRIGLEFIESVYRQNCVAEGEPSSVLTEIQRLVCLAATPELTDDALLHLKDTHVGSPTEKLPLTDADWINFARAAIAAAAGASRAGSEPVKGEPDPELNRWLDRRAAMTEQERLEEARHDNYIGRDEKKHVAAIAEWKAEVDNWVQGWRVAVNRLNEVMQLLTPEQEAQLTPQAKPSSLVDPLPLDYDTEALIQPFAQALRDKLAKAQAKYGFTDGWMSPDWLDECRGQLAAHIIKGDPLDVAAYCAFLWHHKASTTIPAPDYAPSVLRAALHVERWWVEESIGERLGGAPACMFNLRAALATPTPQAAEPVPVEAVGEDTKLLAEWPIHGVRADRGTVVIVAKGNVKSADEAARWMCGELLAMLKD